jgi:uncharacterized protein YndB with AHSA1/START domain
MNQSNLVVMREAKAVEMSRVFDATPERVWRIYTDPVMIPKWWGPRRLTTVVDKMEVRVGGGWRYIQTDTDGSVHAFRGEYKVVDPPSKLIATFEYEPLAGHLVTDTYRFEALPGDQTKVTVKSVFDTLEALEGMLQAGMESGATESWDRLAELLAASGVMP